MTERKPSSDAVSVLLDAVKPSTGAGLARESAGYAPIDRQAGASNIHSDPSPQNFPRRSCFNKTYAPGYWVLTRKWFEDGRFELVNEWVPHRTSTDCRYDFMASDPECIGCKWRIEK